MSDSTDDEASEDSFHPKARDALLELFEKARSTNELHFAMALMPEFRGMQDAGWSTAEESARAFDQYSSLLDSIDDTNVVRVRVALDFYTHVSEGAGFYEIPKKLLLTIDGNGNNISPFQNLVERHKRTGAIKAPNANRIMQDLVGHSETLGLISLADTFRDAFDPDIRNAVAHADYIIWRDGLRLRKRNGGQPIAISWEELNLKIDRGLSLFEYIRELTNAYIKSYETPKTIKTHMNKNEPLQYYTIKYDPETGGFGFSTCG